MSDYRQQQEQQEQQEYEQEMKDKEFSINHISNFDKRYLLTSLTDCWEWSGSKYKNGYGHFTIKRNGKTYNFYAHRYQYKRWFGEISGNVIAHKCDNRCCVNPYHLFACSQKENMADMISKGRSAKGNKHRSKKGYEILKGSKVGCSKLNESLIKEIRNKRLSGKTLLELASSYGVAFQTISKIINGKSWRHV